MGKKIRPLPTKAYLHEIFIYDPETGLFHRKTNRRRWKAGQLCGSLTTDGYININVDRAIYRAHRLAWMYMTGEDPCLNIDHANGIRDDNRWSNLRLANQSDNMCNRPTKVSSLGLPRGVNQGRNGKYFARVKKGSVILHLGTFSSVNEAKAAYEAASLVLHGKFKFHDPSA